jgi:signal transduction histidine kinase
MLCLCLLAVLCLAVSGFAADRQAIQGNVDGIVSAIDAGKNAQEVQANDYDPYVYIMEQDGTLVVHPELSGQSLKEVAEPVYDAVMRATHDGVWVDYEWKGAQKHSYVRKTEGGLIVGSGYTE